MRFALACALALAGVPGTAEAEDWPNWRGPLGTGVSPESSLPTEWGPDTVAWKIPLAGLSVSSPVVAGERVFVSSQAGRGPRREGNHPALARGADSDADAEKPLGSAGPEAEGRVQFVIEAFAAADGRSLWQHRFDADGELPGVHDKHNLSSASPLTDGERVYAWFATGQIVALDVGSGEPVWQRNLAGDYAPFVIDWGHASSPALHGELLYLLCDHEPDAYLVALDRRSGEEKWRVERPEGTSAWSTPLVVDGPQGAELIVNSNARIDAYDPETGELLWWTGEPNRFAVPSPSAHDGVLYMSRGYRSGPYMALRTGGRGDVSASHVLWSVATGAPYISSLLYYDGLIYMANGNGVVTCVDASNGERVWQDRLGGIFSASPVAGAGRIYLVSETGEMLVLVAGRELKLLARNDVGERTSASPAISGGRLFIRTERHLIAVGGP